MTRLIWDQEYTQTSDMEFLGFLVQTVGYVQSGNKEDFNLNIKDMG